MENTSLQEKNKSESPRRAIVASSFGNLMENYDNLIYAYSAVWIGQLFFPEGDPATGLLYTFAIFAVGFMARPLGTLAFGHFGDRAGRRAALLLSVLLMGVATVLIGITPTYATIGIAAPILLVFFRLVQGFSVAGEWAGSAAMLVEYAPKHRRGFFGSFNQVSTAAGFLLASSVVAVNTLLFTEEQLLAWAWRVPFLLAAVTAIAAIILRMGLKDTPAFRAERKKGTVTKNPLKMAFRTQFGAIARGFGFTVVWTVAYFFFLTYIPTYLTDVAGVDQQIASVSNVTALVIMTVAIALFGFLSDRFGRKPFLYVGSVGFLLFSFPALAIFLSGSVVGIFLAQIVIGLILASFSGPGPAALSEFFPTVVRYSALGIGYNFSVMAFGGTAPFISTGLVNATGSDLIPALVPTVAALITLVVVFFMPETYKSELR